MGSNYTKKDTPSVKVGKIADVIKPKKRLFTRTANKSSEEHVIAMKVDIVQILAGMGIVLSNTHTIARDLISRGWVKTIKMDKNT